MHGIHQNKNSFLPLAGKNQPMPATIKKLLHISVYIWLPLGFGTLIYLKGTYSIPIWIRYNLPDGLWLFALLNTFAAIWGSGKSSLVLWAVTVILLSIIMEYLQKMHLIPGTFDLWDILAYVLASLLSASIYFLTNLFKKLKSNEPSTPQPPAVFGDSPVL
jgi:hypothetical protein